MAGDLMFDPNAMAAPPSAITPPAAPQVVAPPAGISPAPDQNDVWTRIQDAMKRGLISQQQADQIAMKMGYSKTTPKAPDIAGAGAGAIGAMAGNVLGKVGSSVGRMLQQPAPSDTAGKDMTAPAPSPQWDQ